VLHAEIQKERLAAAARSGAETVLSQLQKELEMVMRQAGTTSVKRIMRDYIAERRAWLL